MVTHLKFCNWSKSFILASQLHYRASAAWPWKALEWRILISTKWIVFSITFVSVIVHHTVVQNRMRKRVVFYVKPRPHMCFWQNREVFSFPGRRDILYSWPSWQEFEREEKRLFSRLSFSFRTPATQDIVLVISHIRYTSWLKSYEAFWSFSYIWFGFLCAQVFFGN